MKTCTWHYFSLWHMWTCPSITN